MKFINTDGVVIKSWCNKRITMKYLVLLLFVVGCSPKFNTSDRVIIHVNGQQCSGNIIAVNTDSYYVSYDCTYKDGDTTHYLSGTGIFPEYQLELLK